MAKGAPKAEARAISRPKLSIEHFSFMRGWCQGLDPKDLWMRYLPRFGEFDARRCRTFIKDLQTELGAVARRSGRPELAALLKRHSISVAVPPAEVVSDDSAGGSTPAGSAPLPPSPAKMPSLEEFSLQFDEDMYSEAELIELWEDARKELEAENSALPSPSDSTDQQPRTALPSTASDTRESRALLRRARLIERQLEMLEWLEHLACEAPQPSDEIRAWLDGVTCDRLEQVGIVTLQNLMDYVRIKGYRWYSKVPKIGEKGANVIVTWLGKQSATLGGLPVHALVPRTKLDTDDKMEASAMLIRAGGGGSPMTLAPLERLSVPSSLATAEPGAPGSNRASAASSKLQATNDFDAVQEWLALWAQGSHTWRAYRREAERFLLWSIFGRGKPLSGLNSLDCVAYRDFMASPGPEWCGPRNALRWSPEWRPFEGPLSPRSTETAMTILSSMCEWLSRRRYLDTNPFDGVPKAVRAPAMPSSRAFTRRQWQLVEEWLDALPSDPANNRLKLLLGFAYRSGLRESELAAAKVEWIRHEQLDDGTWSWSLMVLGKRNKWREVMLPESAVELIRESFVADGLGSDLTRLPPDTPIFARLPSLSGTSNAPRQPLTPGRIYEIIKGGFTRCANDIACIDAGAADRLRRASTHWLRHTYGSHAAESMPIQILQMQMGHESPTTTAIYTKAEKVLRQQAVRAAFDKAAKAKAPTEAE